MASNTWGIVGTAVGAVIGAVVGYVGGGPYGAVMGGIKGAAIGGTVGGVVDAVTAPTQRQNKPDFRSSPTYGFNVRNTIDPNTSVAARYGEHMVPAHIISSHITQESKRKQSISVLCGIGEGEIDSVSDVRLDGTSIWDEVEDTRFSKKGNGKRAQFDFAHAYGHLDDESVVIKVAGVTQTLTTDYTIEGTRSKPCIQFTHDAVPADGAKVTYSARYSPMGVDVNLRTGTSGQALIPAFNEIAQTHTLNKTLTYEGGGYTWRTKRKVEDLVVHILAPYGLIHHHKGKDAGKTSTMYSACAIEVRTVSDAGVTGDWIQILGDKKRDDPINPLDDFYGMMHPTNSYTGEFGVSGETTSPIRWAFRLTDFLWNERKEKFPGWSTPTRVDVRVTKTAEDYTGEQANRLINTIALEHVTEVTYDKVTYPYTALLGLEGIANDQLSGAFPEITIVGKFLKIEDLHAETDAAWSDSFPWAVADLLTNSRYGLGKHFTSSDLDLTSFNQWASFCETSVPNPGRPSGARYRYDGSVDSGEVAIDALRRICAQAQGLLVWSEGQWSIVVDHTTTAQETGFTDGSDGEDANIVADSMKWTEPTDDPPNVLVGEFQNRENDWEMDTLTVEDRPSLDDGDPVVEQTVSLYGTTRPEQVARSLVYYLRSAQRSRVTAQWEARAIGMLYTPGDVVPVTHDPSGWDEKLFRIMAVEWTERLTVRYVAREYDESIYAGTLDAVRTTLKRPSVAATLTPTPPPATYPAESVTALNLSELDD